MADRLDAVLTKSTALDVGQAMIIAWWHLWSQVPLVPSILVLMAQSALETAQWARMKCFSLGGVKSRDGDGYDYSFFTTSECLTASGAKAMILGAGARSDATGADAEIVGACGDGLTKVRLYPDHPGSRFRAFRSLELAAVDHLAMLKSHRSFGHAWPAVAAGDPRSFANLLKQAGYYTGPAGVYGRQLELYFKQFSSLNIIPEAVVQAAEAKYKETKDGIDQSRERDRIQAMVALSMQQMIDSMADDRWK